MRQASTELPGKLMSNDKLQDSVRQVMKIQICSFSCSKAWGSTGIVLQWAFAEFNVAVSSLSASS